MANQQLMDYIKQQLQAGATKETIRSVLLNGGWPENDVTEAMAGAGIGEPKPASPVAQGLAAKTSQVIGGVPGSSAPAVITTDVVAPKGSITVTASRVEKISSAEPSTAKHRAVSFPTLFLGLASFLLLGAGGWLYKTNADLSAQISVLTNENATLGAQAALLTKKVNDFSAQVASLTNDNNNLSAQLALFVTPASSSANVAVPVTVKGTLQGGLKAQYTLVTDKNITVYVKNYRDPRVDAALKPLLGAMVQISGTHLPGSRDITVTAVNGTDISAAPTSTSAVPNATTTGNLPPQ